MWTLSAANRVLVCSSYRLLCVYFTSIIIQVPYAYVQEFTEGLTVEQCRTLLSQVFNNHGGLELARSQMQHGQPEVPPDNNNHRIPWCVCGKSREMEQPNENICCRKQPCICTTEYFTSVVLDTNVLSIAIVNRSDVYADDPDYSPASYRKSAYRQ